MNFLLDTCVISEFVKPRPASELLDWVANQSEERLYISVLTIGELLKGIRRLGEGRRKNRLDSWLENDVKPAFGDRVLPVSQPIAERWGLLRAESERSGHPLPAVDALLAATALVHGMTLVTRNEADLRAAGALVLNPWR